MKSPFRLILPALALVLSACAPAASSPTPTTQMEETPPTPTELPQPSATPSEEPGPAPQVELLFHSSYEDKALVDPPGDGWEGSYSWAPYGLYHEGSHYIFYNGYDGGPEGVGLATSTDGLHFTRYAGNPVLEPPSATTMSIGPVVYVDEDGTWIMFVVEDQVRRNLAGDSVVRYSAPDPTGPWTASNQGAPVYAAPSEDHWTSRMVVRSIAFVEDEIWLAFHARHEDSSVDIGILVSEDGGMSFELRSEEPVLSPGPREDGMAMPSARPCSSPRMRASRCSIWAWCPTRASSPATLPATISLAMPAARTVSTGKRRRTIP